MPSRKGFRPIVERVNHRCLWMRFDWNQWVRKTCAGSQPMLPLKHRKGLRHILPQIPVHRASWIGVVFSLTRLQPDPNHHPPWLCRGKGHPGSTLPSSPQGKGCWLRPGSGPGPTPTSRAGPFFQPRVPLPLGKGCPATLAGPTSCHGLPSAQLPIARSPASRLLAFEPPRGVDTKGPGPVAPHRRSPRR